MDFEIQLDSVRNNVFNRIEEFAFSNILRINKMNESSESFEKEALLQIEQILKSRGYVKSSFKDVWIRGFVCAQICSGEIAIWHDIKGSKTFKLDKSIVSGLDLTLKYFERNML